MNAQQNDNRNAKHIDGDCNNCKHNVEGRYCAKTCCALDGPCQGHCKADNDKK